LWEGSPNSHKKARDELRAAGLLEFEERGTEGFLFRLCDPETGKPWAGGPKEKITYQKKTARQASTSIVNQPDSSSPRWSSAAAGRTDRSVVEASALGTGNNRRSATRLTRDSLPALREIDQTEIESKPLASGPTQFHEGWSRRMRRYAGPTLATATVGFEHKEPLTCVQKLRIATIENCVPLSAEIDCPLQELRRGPSISARALW
jgi:hypothetical protein